jgi:hypothetical protein
MPTGIPRSVSGSRRATTSQAWQLKRRPSRRSPRSCAPSSRTLGGGRARGFLWVSFRRFVPNQRKRPRLGVMEDSRLSCISFLLPNSPAESIAFFEAVASLLAQVPGTNLLPNQVIWMPTSPTSALPVTVLQSCGVRFPEVVFETKQLIEVYAGRLHLHSSTIASKIPVSSSGVNLDATPLLPVEELCSRLHGRLIRIDHTGVNIPETSLDRPSWNLLLHQLGAIAALYRYPTGMDWPFILPTTSEEFEGEIHHFVAGRGPRFELVYEQRDHPLLQFSVKTDLSQAEAELLFPEPYGGALPGLGHIFRSVHVAQPWPELSIRFDLYFRGENGVSEWESGEWLATQGGRIR